MPKRGRRVLCETRVFARPPVSMGTARNSKNNLIKSYFTTSSSRERWKGFPVRFAYLLLRKGHILELQILEISKKKWKFAFPIAHTLCS